MTENPKRLTGFNDTRTRAFGLFVFAFGCRDSHAQSSSVDRRPSQLTSATIASSTAQDARSAIADATAPRALAQSATASAGSDSDLDGNDDPEDPGSGTLDLSTPYQFVSIGRAPGGLRRVCDLTVFRDALYVAAANTPLGSDGAVISRYQPAATGPSFRIAFDWNRPGQPTQGGGGGQGFVRVHHIGDRLFVPDADPPYGGFGISGTGTDGFVFVSDSEGRFAPARGATLRPPSVPNAQGYLGAGVLPRAYHVLDVLKFRGHYYASTGSVAPGQRAWYGASPGALHVANERLSRWSYAIDYPRPYQNGVWRLTYMTRFRSAIYAGIQDYDGRDPNDFVRINPPPGVVDLTQEHLRGQRVSARGGSLTLRWYTDRGRLFWIAIDRGEAVRLRWTNDGSTWRVLELPPDAGAPSDIVRFRDNLVILAENGLYRVADSLDPQSISQLAAAPDIAAQRAAFRVTDAFCASPLAVYRNALYAGSQLGSRVYRLE
jgi:hypothetical protein